MPELKASTRHVHQQIPSQSTCKSTDWPCASPWVRRSVSQPLSSAGTSDTAAAQREHAGMQARVWCYLATAWDRQSQLQRTSHQVTCEPHACATPTATHLIALGLNGFGAYHAQRQVSTWHQHRVPVPLHAHNTAGIIVMHVAEPAPTFGWGHGLPMIVR